MATPLSKKLAGATAAAAKTPLAAVLERGDRGELVELLVLGPAWILLLGHEDVQTVESEVIEAMGDRNIPAPIGDVAALTALTWEAERAVRTLARAVRSPDDRKAAFGTLAEWAKVDPDTLLAAWHVYGDVRERLAPLDVELTADERIVITAACKKKDTTLLRSFGVSALAIYLATMECPPESSPTPTSSDGPSSSDS